MQCQLESILCLYNLVGNIAKLVEEQPDLLMSRLKVSRFTMKLSNSYLVNFFLIHRSPLLIVHSIFKNEIRKR